MSGLVVVSDTHTDQFKQTFNNFSLNKILTDVTLVCDDKVKIEAHRIILCAGSSMFKEFFIDNPHSHPILYLKGVKQQHLQHILEYLYDGKTKLPQKDVNHFLNLAKDLEVLGLETEGESEDVQEQLEHQQNTKRNPNKCQDCSFQGLSVDSLEKHIEFVHKGYSSKSKLAETKDHETLKIDYDDSVTEKDQVLESSSLISWEGEHLYPPANKPKNPSIIWNFGGFRKHSTTGQLDKGVYVCSFCGRELSYCASTSNIMKHITRHHKNQIPLNQYKTEVTSVKLVLRDCD